MELHQLIRDIRKCETCAAELTLGPRPVVSLPKEARIAVIGQAPGTKVHASGIPWDDQSGIRLRNWLGVEPEFFYESDRFAILPMGFCYPGKGKSGDLPPRKECAPLWHKLVLDQLPNIKLILLIGSYAQKYYLGRRAHHRLTDTVRNYADYGPLYFPIVHPSPRNKIWQKKNPWFEEEVIPVLRNRMSDLL